VPKSTNESGCITIPEPVQGIYCGKKEHLWKSAYTEQANINGDLGALIMQWSS